MWPIGQINAEEKDAECINTYLLNSHLKYNSKQPSVRLFHQFDLALHAGSPRIGWPIFELTTFTENEINHLKSQHKLIVCSNWAKTVIQENKIDVPTVVVPLGVDRTIFHENRRAKRKDNSTAFLNIGKLEYRKGHDVLSKAFNAAFIASDNVTLKMHWTSPFVSKEDGQQWEKMYKNTPLGNKITISNERLNTPYDIAGMIAECDVGVFPSRAEGWNLPALEMLSMGKRIIATNYSAHTEFLSASNASLIQPTKLATAMDGVWFRGEQTQIGNRLLGWPNGVGQWMDFGKDQFDQLVEHMRALHKLKQEGNFKLNVEGVEIGKKYIWANSANLLWAAVYA